MKRSFKGCVWLVLGLMAIIGTGVVVMQNRLASLREERQQAFDRDAKLDRSFNARKPRAINARVMLSTAQGNYQVPADLPSFRQHIASMGKLPAVIVLDGCGFPVWGKDVPPNVAILSVEENPHLLTPKTAMEACLSKDPLATGQAFQRNLDFLVEFTNKADWVDRKRIMIAGYGEAAPVVAAYSGPANQRLTLGDPCYVPWSKIANGSPLLMLLTEKQQGLMVGRRPPVPLDVTAIAKGADPSLPNLLPDTNSCAGLARPEIVGPAKQVIAAGRLGTFDMPLALMNARKTAYEGL